MLEIIESFLNTTISKYTIIIAIVVYTVKNFLEIRTRIIENKHRNTLSSKHESFKDLLKAITSLEFILRKFWTGLAFQNEEILKDVDSKIPDAFKELLYRKRLSSIYLNPSEEVLLSKIWDEFNVVYQICSSHYIYLGSKEPHKNPDRETFIKIIEDNFDKKLEILIQDFIRKINK